jgi:hypothetical protein
MRTEVHTTCTRGHTFIKSKDVPTCPACLPGRYKTVSGYNKEQIKSVRDVCNVLRIHIDKQLKKSESKIWHGSPVWFIEGNPIVSYSVRKDGRVSLMFFSGQSFDEKDLKPEGTFKAAEIFYTDVKEIKITSLKRWIKKAVTIQWDYKNIVKRRGVLKKVGMYRSEAVQKTLHDTSAHDERFAKMAFSTVYPLYLAKIEKKGRTKKELDHVIQWLTGFNIETQRKLVQEKATFETLFKKATLHKNAHLITGVICGYRIEDIKNPLTRNVRYLDKLVDELAKGRAIEKILR